MKNITENSTEKQISIVVDAFSGCIQGTCLIGADVKKDLFNDTDYIGKYVQLTNHIHDKTIELCVVGNSIHRSRTLCNSVDLLSINCDIDLDVVDIKIANKREEE